MRHPSEEQPFFGGSSEEANGDMNSRRSAFSKRWECIPIFIRFLICFCLIVLYTAGIFTLSHLRGPTCPPLNNALSNPKLLYKPTLSITAGQSPYAGGPSQETDDAWHDLMSSISLRVSQEELNRNGNHQESIALPESGGHLVWLGVFHQLHCLKMIRQMNYREYYHPNQSEHDARDMEVHINHCIEQLRQSLMCSPDTSFTTFVWTHSDPRPVLDVRRFERKCVDWDEFMKPISPRVVSFEEVDGLKNPMLRSSPQDSSVDTKH